jgi:hypothetical protein
MYHYRWLLPEDKSNSEDYMILVLNNAIESIKDYWSWAGCCKTDTGWFGNEWTV